MTPAITSVTPESRCPRCQAPGASGAGQHRMGVLCWSRSVHCNHCGLVEEELQDGFAPTWIRDRELQRRGWWQADIRVAGGKLYLEQVSQVLAAELDLPAGGVLGAIRNRSPLFVGTRIEAEWLASISCGAGVGVIIEQPPESGDLWPALWIDGDRMRLGTEAVFPQRHPRQPASLPPNRQQVLVGYPGHWPVGLLPILESICPPLRTHSSGVGAVWIESPFVSRPLVTTEVEALSRQLIASKIVLPDPAGRIIWQPESGAFLDIDINEITTVLNAHRAQCWDVRGAWQSILYFNFPRYVAALSHFSDSLPGGEGCYFDKYTRRIHTQRYVDVRTHLRRQPEGVLDSLLFTRLDD